MNDRLQLVEQELKKGSEVLQKYDYSYGTVDLATGTVDATKNNGQLGKVEGWIGANKQWSQRFGYGELGRLTDAREYKQGDNAQLTYKQKFNFDRFGNMYRKAASNPTAGQANPLPYTAIEDADISRATNRFATETTYDDAGNVTIDNKFRDMSFGYDANGRMVKATKASTPDALSVYDASGLRVAERVNDVWRFSIFDIGGKCVAEYGGPPSTDDGGVKYVLSDWQGSTRAVINNAGFVNSRSDYTAYGENIASGVGLRTVTQGFGASNDLRQKYALTERDDATGLDHTPWRKHENNAGRWTSPDPYNGSMSLADPQSFNRYSYVQNDPTNFVYPTGLSQENEWRCELWTTFHDPDGPDGPVKPYEVGPRFWQCYLVPSAGGPTATVDVNIGDGGGGGEGQNGPTPLAIGNSCATLAGTAATGVELAHVADGMWRGANGKWYSMSWGGNQWTKGRSIATSAAKTAKKAGGILFGATVVIDIAQVANGESSPSEAGYDMLMSGAAAFGGVPGMFVAAPYYGNQLISLVPDPGGSCHRLNRSILTNKLGPPR